MRFILLILICLKAFPEPWLNISDSKALNSIIYELKSCKEWDKNYISYPISLGEINFYIEKIKNKNLNNLECQNDIDALKTNLINKFIQSREVIFGIQSGSDNQYFQTKNKRYYKDNNNYFSFSDINSNFAYKLQIINTDQDSKNYFDESYISYKYKNHIFTAGRISRWWSPSDSFSLIMSNSARPSMGIEYKNYVPIDPERAIFKFFGHINYEFFVNKLEKEREIPNTLLFGNRVTFNPNESLKFSLLRLAQFGGKNRPKDASTILKMLVGNDNTSSSLSFDEQPGNQLAGLDFIYSPKKNRNLKIYGQLVGEDEAGYFPSRKLHLFGLSYGWDDLNSTKLNIDYIDTYSGKENYSYNHKLYKSGLRYYGIPIGASIDADSEALKFSLKKDYNKFQFEFSFSDIILNKNNSELNYWTKQKEGFNQIDMLLKYQHKNMVIDLIYTQRDTKFDNFSKNNLFTNIYFKF